MAEYDYTQEISPGGYARKKDLVRVVFDDSDFEYAYYTGGMFLKIGDLVVTPRPSTAGRFGFFRYNQQGVATVVGFGGDRNYSGPYKTLVGRVVTGPASMPQKGEPKKPDFKIDLALAEQRLMAEARIAGIEKRVREIEEEGCGGISPSVPIVRRVEELERQVRRLKHRLDNDRHTHRSSGLGPIRTN